MGMYSALTYFIITPGRYSSESIFLNNSKITEHKVIKNCKGQSYQNCDISVLIWNTPITINAKCLSLLCEGTFRYDCKKYIWDLAPDKLTIQRNLRYQRSRSQKK